MRQRFRSRRAVWFGAIAAVVALVVSAMSFEVCSPAESGEEAPIEKRASGPSAGRGMIPDGPVDPTRVKTKPFVGSERGAGPLTLQLLRQSGLPAANFPFVVRSPAPRSFSSTLRTDEEGKATLSLEATPGRWKLCGQPWSKAEVPFEPAKDGATTLVVLPPMGQLSIRFDKDEELGSTAYALHARIGGGGRSVVRSRGEIGGRTTERWSFVPAGVEFDLEVTSPAGRQVARFLGPRWEGERVTRVVPVPAPIRLSGTLMKADGNALADTRCFVRVAYEGPEGQRTHWGESLLVRTDEGGRFVTCGGSDDWVHRDAGHAPKMARFGKRNGRFIPVDVPLPTSTSGELKLGEIRLKASELIVAGRVTDHAGGHLAGTVLVVSRWDPGGVGWAPWKQGMTDSQGRFRVQGDHDGNGVVSIRAHHSKYDFGRASKNRFPVGSDDVVLVGTPAASVTGRVVAARIADPRWLTPRLHNADGSRPGTMNPDGVFRFDNVSPGHYALSLSLARPYRELFRTSSSFFVRPMSETDIGDVHVPLVLGSQEVLVSSALGDPLHTVIARDEENRLVTSIGWPSHAKPRLGQDLEELTSFVLELRAGFRRGPPGERQVRVPLSTSEPPYRVRFFAPGHLPYLHEPRPSVASAEVKMSAGPVLRLEMPTLDLPTGVEFRVSAVLKDPAQPLRLVPPLVRGSSGEHCLLRSSGSGEVTLLSGLIQRSGKKRASKARIVRLPVIPSTVTLGTGGASVRLRVAPEALSSALAKLEALKR